MKQRARAVHVGLSCRRAPAPRAPLVLRGMASGGAAGNAGKTSKQKAVKLLTLEFHLLTEAFAFALN